MSTKKTVIVLAFEGEVPGGTVFQAFAPNGVPHVPLCHAGMTLNEDHVRRSSSDLAKLYGFPLTTAIFNRLAEPRER